MDEHNDTRKKFARQLTNLLISPLTYKEIADKFEVTEQQLTKIIQVYGLPARDELRRQRSLTDQLNELVAKPLMIADIAKRLNISVNELRSLAKSESISLRPHDRHKLRSARLAKELKELWQTPLSNKEIADKLGLAVSMLSRVAAENKLPARKSLAARLSSAAGDEGTGPTKQDPTPEQIAERAAEQRRNWTESIRQQRLVVKESGPVVAPAYTMNANGVFRKL